MRAAAGLVAVVARVEALGGKWELAFGLWAQERRA